MRQDQLVPQPEIQAVAPVQQDPETPVRLPVQPPHTHKFVPHYTTTTKQTGQEWVPNLVQVGSKTVCNGCRADITGNVEHANREHCGYHSEPIYEDQGWYEPVYSEVQVIDYYYCSFCGQRQ